MQNKTSSYKMFEIPSFTLCFTFLLFLFMVVKHLNKSRPQKPYTKSPPGPWKLPIIGNLHQLIGPSLPHHCLRNLAKKHGPIMHLQLGEGSAIVISSPSAAEAVLKTNELSFSQRPKVLAIDIIAYGGLGIVFSPYGDFWRQIRKFCMMELLSTKRVQSFKSVREEEVKNLIQSISLSSSKHVIDLSKAFFLLTTSITARAAFGNKCEDADEFIAVLKEGTEMAGGFDMLDIFPSLRILPFVNGMKSRLEKMHKRMDKVLDNIINEHKAKRATSGASKEKDLVDVLLKLQESDDTDFPITATNIKAIVFDIFSAGTETAAITMEWAMSEMLKNPEVMHKAQNEVQQVLTKKKNITEEDIKELQYLKLVIKETLRLHPPTPLILRECREKCEINGFDIPMKEKVIINFWAIARDSEHWPDAECFLPERFEGLTIDYKGINFEYIPFGAGRRICPGISFAITTIELSLALLLYYFDWKLPDGLEPNMLDMSEAFGLIVKKRNALYVIATPSSCT